MDGNNHQSQGPTSHPKPLSTKQIPRGKYKYLYEDCSEVLSQAERIIKKFGGARRLMRALEQVGCPKNAASIYRWAYPPERGGRGGLVPTHAWPGIFKAARMEGVFIDRADIDPRDIENKKRRIVGLLDKQGNEHPFIPIEELKAADRAARAEKEQAEKEQAMQAALKAKAEKEQAEKKEAEKQRGESGGFGDDDIFS